MGASVISGVNTPPILEFGEHILDLVALSVEVLVVGDLDFSALPWRDARCNALVDQGLAEPIGIVTSVGQHVFRFGQNIQQQGCSLIIAHLAFG